MQIYSVLKLCSHLCRRTQRARIDFNNKKSGSKTTLACKGIQKCSKLPIPLKSAKLGTNWIIYKKSFSTSRNCFYMDTTFSKGKKTTLMWGFWF